MLPDCLWPENAQKDFFAVFCVKLDFENHF